MGDLGGEKEKVNVIFVGQSGAGKSKLLGPLFGYKEERVAVTKQLISFEVRQLTWPDLTFRVTDTFGGFLSSPKQVKYMRYHKIGIVDIFVYCLAASSILKILP